MSLAPGEQRALIQIEGMLCRSDPKLAAMLSTFNHLTCNEGMPRREFLFGRSSRLRRVFPEAPLPLICVIPLAVAAFALGLIVMFFALIGHASRPASAQGTACGTVSLRACRPPAGAAGRARGPGGNGDVGAAGRARGPGGNGDVTARSAGLGAGRR
jgi:hypothetical protein